METNEIPTSKVDATTVVDKSQKKSWFKKILIGLAAVAGVAAVGAGAYYGRQHFGKAEMPTAGLN